MTEIPLTIVVQYSCDLCGLANVSVVVPARDEEPVTVWMEATIRIVSGDHRKKKPRCHPKTLSKLMIPDNNRAKVGGPTTN